MRILSVSVKNFRMHEDLKVDFGRERTVVAGPNESGKSTLVEALVRAFFYASKSKTDLDEIKPKAGGGAPEVTLRFEHGGRTYDLRKVFRHQQGFATLSDDTCKAYEDAEAHLQQILGLTEYSSKKPPLGWAHLWARQGAAGAYPMHGEALGNAAKVLDTRLKSMTGTGVIESPCDRDTSDRVTEEYDDTFKKKGGAANSSMLFAAAKELSSAREAASQAESLFAEFEDAVDTIVKEEAAIEGHRKTLDEARQQLEQTRKQLVAIQAVRDALAEEETAAEAAATDHAELEKGDREIAALAKSIDKLSQELTPKNNEIETLRQHEQQLQRVINEAVTAIEVATAARQVVVLEEDVLKAVGKVFELQSDRSDLERALHEIGLREQKRAAIDERLRKLPVVDRPTVEEIERLDRELELGIRHLEASAAIVEVLQADAAVAVAGRPLGVGEGIKLADTAELTVGDGTVIRVSPGGGESLVELRAGIAELKDEISTRLAELGLKAAGEARPIWETRETEEASRKQLDKEITDLGGKGVQTALDDVKAEIEKVEADITRRKPDGFTLPSDAAAARSALAALEQRRNAADEAVGRAREALNSASGDFTQTQNTRNDREDELTNDSRELRDLETQKAALERLHGTDREEKLTTLARAKRDTAAAAAATAERLENLAPTLVEADEQRLNETLTTCNDAITAADKRKAVAEAKLPGNGTIDLHVALATAHNRLETALRRHAEIDQRAQAVRLLKTLFDEQRQAVADLVAAPLKRKVTEYLDALYGPGTRVSVTKTGEKFQDLKVTRKAVTGIEFDFEELSGGTREQVAAACRLAMAEVLAGDGNGDGAATACLPVVFDDAFVNSDPERIKAVQRVLYLGASRGLQIIVLSSNPDEYRFFGATQVELPPPKPAPHSISGTMASSRQIDDAGRDDEEDDESDSAQPAAALGQRPEGDDATLATAFVAALRTFPAGKAVKKQLLEQLGWDDDTYTRIKTALVAEGRLKPRRGPGGGVELVDDETPPA